jgi:two-component system invasion response regulator UvrY
MSGAQTQNSAARASIPRPKVRTIVVDDQLAFREVLRNLVGATPGFELVGEANSGEDAIAAVDAVSPDMVLMDVRMPGLGGIETARRLARTHPKILLVLISVHGLEELPSGLLEGKEPAVFVHKQSLRPRMLRQLWDEHHGG